MYTFTLLLDSITPRKVRFMFARMRYERMIEEATEYWQPIEVLGNFTKAEQGVQTAHYFALQHLLQFHQALPNYNQVQPELVHIYTNFPVDTALPRSPALQPIRDYFYAARRYHYHLISAVVDETLGNFRASISLRVDKLPYQPVCYVLNDMIGWLSVHHDAVPPFIDARRKLMRESGASPEAIKRKTSFWPALIAPIVGGKVTELPRDQINHRLEPGEHLFYTPSGHYLIINVDVSRRLPPVVTRIGYSHLFRNPSLSFAPIPPRERFPRNLDYNFFYLPTLKMHIEEIVGRHQLLASPDWSKNRSVYIVNHAHKSYTKGVSLEDNPLRVLCVRPDEGVYEFDNEDGEPLLQGQFNCCYLMLRALIQHDPGKITVYVPALKYWQIALTKASVVNLLKQNPQVEVRVQTIRSRFKTRREANNADVIVIPYQKDFEMTVA
ncbi:hypothetical protein [uncultured Umboniibacter sp.]|uniref:hypothetical protein n=1 Tax=uncultured Umboniibacter sp. TaxID=1798917 RepID=UPI00261E9008|nr:hypothetical protein [uncultured Umboniibacter sp.]